MAITAKCFKNEVTEIITLSPFRQQLFITIFCGLHPIGGPFLTPTEIKVVGRDVIKAIFTAYISLTQNQLRNEWIHSTLDWSTRQSKIWWSCGNVNVIGKFLPQFSGFY